MESSLHVCVLSHDWLCDSMDCSRQAPLSVGVLKQENWSRWPFSSPGDLPGPGVKAASPAVQADSIQLSHWGSPKSSLEVKVPQSCPTLSMDYTVRGILQARILEWVAFPCSRGSSQARDRTHGYPALQVNSLPAKPRASPRILEWVYYPFSSGSSWPSNSTGVSCTAGGFFTNWAARVVQKQPRGEHFFECN